MRRVVMLSLMVAAVVLCNHWSATAEEEQQVELAEVSNSHISPWTLSVPSENNDGCHEIFKCMLYPNRSCITECCKSYPFSLFPTKFCICWSRAERVNKRAFTALQEYCGFKQYVKCPRMQEINMQQEVDEALKAIDNKLISSRSNQLMSDACCEQDKQKIKSCMFNTTSGEQCCPTFRAMIGVNCNCYNYAQDLDNQLLIVIESLCDVPNPCNKKAQVM